MKSFSQFLNESYLSENEKKKKDIETAAALAAATTGSPTITTSGGYRIYEFTASGSITF